MAEHQVDPATGIRADAGPMIVGSHRPAAAIADLYSRTRGDLGFTEVVQSITITGDADLADLIEADARYRMRHDRPLSLERYLTAIPDLQDRADALDAAIDMAVRALAHTSHPEQSVIEQLVARHPAFETAIREAAALNDAIWSTTRFHRHFADPPARPLPFDFGPMMPDGRRRYELRELLGEGAFGQVYLAVDRQLSEKDHDALVSIKLVTGHGRLPWSRHHLADEATKARRVTHPNVVRVLDRGVSADDEDFIVYEFIDGGDLARWSRQRRPNLNIDEAVRMVAKMARGVHAAHMAGLVHCDLKPANIVVTAQGEPKVADFGIAVRPIEQDTLPYGPAATSEPLGNLAFMSPEQYRAEPGALTIPSDVYALGGILFWLLTSNLPNGKSPDEIRRTHDPAAGRQDPPQLRAFRGEIHPTLEMICQRALAVRPSDRYSSAAALADDLEAWLRHEPVRWTGPSAWQRVGLWARRNPASAVALIVISLVIIVSTIVSLKMASIANQKRVEAALAQIDAAIAQTRADDEERHRKDYAATVKKYGESFERASKEGNVSANLLTKIWATELLFGPSFLGEGLDRFDTWRIRTQIVRQMVQDARDRGEGESLEAALWESVLAFWLVRDGKYAEAEPLLASTIAHWRALLSRDDPWLKELGALQACAAIDRLAAGAAESGTDRRANPELARAAAILDEVEQSTVAIDPTSAIHRTLLDKMRVLYGPALLDNPAKLALVDQKIKDASK